jgi:hypothetical protein
MNVIPNILNYGTISSESVCSTNVIIAPTTESCFGDDDDDCNEGGPSSYLNKIFCGTQLTNESPSFFIPNSLSNCNYSPVNCTNGACPLLLSSKCVFYEGGNLIYTGINTNDTIESALQKIDAKIGENDIILSVIGNSGPATYINNILNIPNYTLTGLGGVPSSRQLTINGVTYDLSANRSWTIDIVAQAKDLIREVYNQSGATMTKGTVVYINGGHGNLPTIAKALATSDATSAQTYGIVQSNIGNMSNGYIVVVGDLTNIDTQAYIEGTQLYLSASAAGQYTNVKQYAPNHLVYIGIVTRSHPTQGVIAVKIQNGYEMDELHNVSAQNPSNNDILQYKTATGLWTKVAGTTSNISEGGNLYYTDARARLAISLTTTGTSGVATYNSSTGVFNIPQYQAAGNYITALSGEATASGPGSAAVTLTNSAVTGKVLTGLNLTGGGSIVATDSILQAFGKVQNQISAMVGGVTYQSVWNASTNSPTLTSSVGTKGYYYIVNVAGSTNLNGITDWRVGDWAIFNGSTWDKVDNTDAVSSVNGFTGAVSLTTANITEATNLYYTDLRARSAISLTTTGASGASTYNSSTGALNIPNYTLAGLGGVSGSGTAGQVSFFTGASVIGGDNGLFWDNTNKRLGIGTTSPAVKLDVNGIARVTTEIRSKNTAGNISYFTFEENANVNSATFISGDARTTGNMGLWTNSLERIRIDNAGNVGIGTTNPSYRLHTQVPSSANAEIFLAGMEGVSNGFTVQRVSSTFIYTLLSGRTLINTNTDNGVDALQVNGSAIASVLKFNTSGETITISSYKVGAGGNNIWIGGGGLSSTSASSNNLSVGGAALFFNTSGSGNMALGAAALFDNTTGSSNVGIGWNAMAYNKTGSNNVSIGDISGGRDAAGSLLLNVNNSIFIGRNTRASAQSNTNEIVIGTDAIGNGSNTVTLGNASIATTILRGSVMGSSFKSDSGTISLPTSVNTQFYSFTQRGLYLVKLYLAGGNQSSIWSATAIVSFDSTDVVTIANVGGTNVVIIVSGTTLLGRNVGSTFTYNYDILRMNTN